MDSLSMVNLAHPQAIKHGSWKIHHFRRFPATLPPEAIHHMFLEFPMYTSIYSIYIYHIYISCIYIHITYIYICVYIYHVCIYITCIYITYHIIIHHISLDILLSSAICPWRFFSRSYSQLEALAFMEDFGPGSDSSTTTSNSLDL